MIVRAEGLCHDPQFELGTGELEDLSEAILESLGLGDYDFDLTLVHDEAMAVVNEAQMGATGPTNVLSFPAADDAQEAVVQEEGEPVFLGDIVLSVDTLARETYLYGQEPREHLVRLLTHAVLHLAGYDHSPEMFSLTDMVVEKLR